MEQFNCVCPKLKAILVEDAEAIDSTIEELLNELESTEV